MRRRSCFASSRRIDPDGGWRRGRPLARALTGLEHLDDLHGRAAARTRRSGRSRIGRGMLGLGRWWSNVEQLAGEREVVGLHATRQQTVVADAVKARWQDVDQEPADEL